MLFVKIMVFGFIDAASDHAHALAYFHSYALFFLILVIVFVVWLLKMILKFIVFERNLNEYNTYSVTELTRNMIAAQPLSYFIDLAVVSSSSVRETNSLVYDLYYAAHLAFNSRKFFYAHGLQKTLYPDQGLTVNVFSTFPKLVSVSPSFKRYLNAGALISLYKSSSPEEVSVVRTLHEAWHNVAFLFPYERVEIPSYTPYTSVEDYITSQLYISSFTLKLKYASWAKLLGKNDSADFLLKSFNTRALTGFSSEKSKFFYKTYSQFSLPSNVLVNFYGSDVRMFFYLFFQNVRHRKILEWVWTCVPAFILLLLLYPSLILLYCYDRPYITKPYLTFKAIGHQWYWSYEYSDYVTSVNGDLGAHVKFDSYMLHQDDLELGSYRLLEVDRRVVLPMGVCIRLVTTSADVLHSWAVPALGVKIDAVPGRLNQFWIVTDRPGTFYGQCSELCGVNHGFMPIAIETTDLVTYFKALSVDLLA